MDLSRTPRAGSRSISTTRQSPPGRPGPRFGPPASSRAATASARSGSRRRIWSAASRSSCPSPWESRPARPGKALEGLRITVAGTTVGAASALADGLGVTVDDGTGGIRAVIGPDALAGRALPSGTSVVVTGPLGQRDSSGTGTSGYRIHATLAGELEVLAPDPTPTPSPARPPVAEPDRDPRTDAVADTSAKPDAGPNPTPRPSPTPTSHAGDPRSRRGPPRARR